MSFGWANRVEATMPGDDGVGSAIHYPIAERIAADGKRAAVRAAHGPDAGGAFRGRSSAHFVTAHPDAGVANEAAQRRRVERPVWIGPLKRLEASLAGQIIEQV